MGPDQSRMPLVEVMEAYLAEKTYRLHMPGHQGGQGAAEGLVHLLGQQAFKADLTEIPGLDDLHQPQGAIKEAQMLAAAAYGAKESFFLVNGATAGIEAAFLAMLKPGDKVFLPRHAHRSVFNALVLSGAYPVYLNPRQHKELSMPLGVDLKAWQQAFDAHPDGKAILLLHPSYEGVVSADQELIDLTKSKGLKIIADEAHGGHFPFHPDLPLTALALGADAVIQGSHKTSGSLTQSGFLHLGQGVDRVVFQDALGLVQSTSPSYLLMASLDGARHQLAMKGRQALSKVQEITAQIRKEIGLLKGFRTWYEELYNDSVVKGVDFTKIILDGLDLGFSGYELAAKLRTEAGIQVEMAANTFILAMVGLGDNGGQQKRLIGALQRIKGASHKKRALSAKNTLKVDYSNIPVLAITPRNSFFAAKKTISLEDSVGEICGELVIPYPPGIPLLCPGEKISAEMVEQIKDLKGLGISWQGLSDPSLNTIRILV